MNTTPSDAPPAGSRIAVIDIGTNAIRLLVGESDGGGDYRVLERRRERTRPGGGLEESGRIAPDAFDASLRALGRLHARAGELGAGDLRVVATAALREARNAATFVEEVRGRLGFQIQVLTPDEEARLALGSARRRFDLGSGRAAIADIGGGSTEIVLVAAGEVEWTGSLPLGAVRLTERFLRSDPPAPEERESLRRHVDEVLRTVPGGLGPAGEPPVASGPLFIGSGGTFTTLAAMAAAAGRADRVEPAAPRGASTDELRALLTTAAAVPIAARRELPGLEPERADIIVAGLEIAERLATRLGAGEVRVNEGGILDGLLLEMLEGDPA